MKPIKDMDRFDIQDEINELKGKKLWQRTDEENQRLIALAHALEDMDGNIKYGDTGEEDFDDSAAAKQDDLDGPLDEYEGDEDEKPKKKTPKKASKKSPKKAAKKPAKGPAKKRAKKGAKKATKKPAKKPAKKRAKKGPKKSK